jgi:hypothetical protein
MLSNQDLAYHRERARAELDQAYRAEHHSAAHAHMQLAGLHMERLKHIPEGSSGSGER